MSEKEKMEITEDTLISDLLEYDKRAAYALTACGMHCVGCDAAAGETLGEACKVHNIEIEMLLRAVKRIIT